MRIETDEDGFWLYVESANEQNITGYRFRIEDPEAFYDHVKGAIGPWLRERDEAWPTPPIIPTRVFACDPDESAGAYELSDPKHPDFHSVHADIWDAREGK